MKRRSGGVKVVAPRARPKARPKAKPQPKALQKIAPPHVTAPRPLGPPAKSSALARGQDLESAFDVWQEHREHHRAALTRLNDERRKLEQQGAFVVGAVRAARGEGAPALTVPGELDAFLGEASSKLDAAKQKLEHEAAASAEKWHATFAEIRAEVRGRVERTLKHVRPTVRLRLRTLAGDKRILHVDRPGPDEAVLLCVLFTGRLPSRYGFLFDDTTDDMRDITPTLYAEEGSDRTRPDAAYVTALLEQPGEALPLKSMMLLKASGTVVRLVERGPVMEAEVADGATFRNVLTRDEAERIAGYLLKLKLDGSIQLELVAE